MGDIPLLPASVLNGVGFFALGMGQIIGAAVYLFSRYRSAFGYTLVEIVHLREQMTRQKIPTFCIRGSPSEKTVCFNGNRPMMELY
jgi:hypothetical protein